MTRIGFAYNQKPDPVDIVAATELPSVDEEPPSRGSLTALAASPAALVAPDDEYAEWDSAETIDAVAHALARHGQVIRLEATDDFPQRLRDARPDIVFNIAEGLRGPNREAHVPAICEFYGIPYSGSDPSSLSQFATVGPLPMWLAEYTGPSSRDSPSTSRTRSSSMIAVLSRSPLPEK